MPGQGSLPLSVTVNGTLKQRSSAGRLIFSAHQLGAVFSAAPALKPGAVTVAGLPDDADAA